MSTKYDIDFRYSDDSGSLFRDDIDQENYKAGNSVKSRKINQDTSISKQSNDKKRDPLTWFGILTPSKLKQGQTHFINC